MKFVKPTFSEESLQDLLKDEGLDCGVIVHYMRRHNNGDVSAFKYAVVEEARGIQETLEKNYG